MYRGKRTWPHQMMRVEGGNLANTYGNYAYCCKPVLDNLQGGFPTTLNFFSPTLQVLTFWVIGGL